MTTTNKGLTEVKKEELTPSQRFTAMVVRNYQNTVGELELSKRQNRLIQSYFVACDTALKDAETRRLKKSDKYRDALPVTWNNVNVEDLARNVVACSRIGYDPALPNQIFMIPYKNNTTNKYDINFMEGYRGKELKVRKYGYETPDSIIVELVYETDIFTLIKKDCNNDTEGYVFEVVDAFNRGNIIGGFYAFVYVDEPYKNKVRCFTLAQIEKRKPSSASVEFWGGKKDKWDSGKKVGQEEVEGWREEMLWKTLYRAAMNDIAIDSEKIDDALEAVLYLPDASEPVPGEGNNTQPPITQAPTKTLSIDDGIEDVEHEVMPNEQEQEPEPEEPKQQPKQTQAPF